MSYADIFYSFVGDWGLWVIKKSGILILVLTDKDLASAECAQTSTGWSGSMDSTFVDSALENMQRWLDFRNLDKQSIEINL